MNDRIAAIVRDWLGGGAKLMGYKPLEGGWINDVLEIAVDREPFHAVLKLPKAATPATDDDPAFVPPECSFAAEAEALRYLREHSRLKVPKVYHIFEESREDSHLLLERLPGANLESIELTGEERISVEEQLADDLLELHSHRGEGFGFIGREPQAKWLDVFDPIIRSNYRKAKPKLDSQTSARIAGALEAMPEAFGDDSVPTLVHGDVWAGNILVDRTPAGPQVSGWVDPGPLYADVEFELAYVSVFGTGGDAFSRRYRASTPVRPGYEVRRLYYWLSTMLIHAWVFGYPRYIQRADELSRKLAEAQS